MTDTNRHDSPADRRGPDVSRFVSRQAQKVRDGQGQLLLYSQFPDDNPAHSAGYHLRQIHRSRKS